MIMSPDRFGYAQVDYPQEAFYKSMDEKQRDTWIGLGFFQLKTPDDLVFEIHNVVSYNVHYVMVIRGIAEIDYQETIIIARMCAQQRSSRWQQFHAQKILLESVGGLDLMLRTANVDIMSHYEVRHPVVQERVKELTKAFLSRVKRNRQFGTVLRYGGEMLT